MRYTQFETLEIETDFEILEFGNQYKCDTESYLEVQLIRTVHNENNPYITYWLIEVQADDSNKYNNEKMIISENLLSTLVVPKASTSTKSESYLTPPTEVKETEEKYEYSAEQDEIDTDITLIVESEVEQENCSSELNISYANLIHVNFMTK